MTDSASRSGWGSGFALGLLVGSLVTAAVLITASVTGYFLLRDRLIPRQPQQEQETAAAADSNGQREAPPRAEPGTLSDDACEARYVEVELTGLTGGGQVRYVLNGKKMCVGEDALTKMLQSMVFPDPKRPKDWIGVLVEFKISPKAKRITDDHLDEAVDAAWAAGAAVLDPPYSEEDGDEKPAAATPSIKILDRK